MGFKRAKEKFVQALKTGSVQHETRVWGKNWVSEERISLEEAASIVAQARGQDCPKPTPHHFDPQIEVWVFKPWYNKKRWYVKGYWLDAELHLVELYLISFHPSESRAE